MNNEHVIEIDTTELRRALNTLLDAIESRSGSSIAVPVDYFWSVPSPQVFDPKVQPSELTIGQVSWSWENLKALRSGDKEPITYSAVWLAEVLAAIGRSTTV